MRHAAAACAWVVLIAAGLTVTAGGSLAQLAQLGKRSFSGSIEHPAIEYGSRPADDEVAALKRRIEAGTVQPAFEPGAGYLRAVLDALDVPIASQILVFSKTGVQQGYTTPQNPRALFFNDTVVVGYIRGAPLLELAAQDPRQGVTFYILSQAPQARPALVRRDGCLSCHQSFNSLDVPGMLVRSNVTSTEGLALRQFGSFVIDHRSPFAERWGGWYVTGTHGSMRHMGNAMLSAGTSPESMVGAATLNRRSLEGAFDPRAYPSAHSDLVALLVFEHQMHLMNLLTRVGWETRVAASERRLDFASGPPRDAIHELVDYLLFVDEAPLPAKVEGTSGFADTFASRGPRDRRGRSLRQLDLTTRLMRYPCSYMIYSAAFDGLPPETRDAVYRRAWQILSGAERDSRYARLSAADRRAVIEILRETKDGLPDYFQ